MSLTANTTLSSALYWFPGKCVHFSCWKQVMMLLHPTLSTDETTLVYFEVDSEPYFFWMDCLFIVGSEWLDHDKFKENNCIHLKQCQIFSVMWWDCCAFDKVSEDLALTDQKLSSRQIHCAEYSVEYYVNSIDYLIYSQSPVTNNHVITFNIFLGGCSCRTSRHLHGFSCPTWIQRPTFVFW